MLNFIKKLFKTKEKIGLLFDNLEEWFDNQTKPEYEKISNRINEIKQSIEEEKGKIKQNIEALKTAELHNKDITTKEEQFMVGNRENYIRRTSGFIDSLNLPEHKLKEYVEKVEKEIDELGKSTLKSYKILQHFFSDQTYAIAQNIKKIDDNFKELKILIADQRIDLIESVKKGIINVKDTIKNEKIFKSELEEIESKLKNLTKEKKSIQSEISHKEQSSEFKEYHRLKVDDYKLNDQIKDIKEDLVNDFSILEQALKKHVKINPEDGALIENYLKDPLEGLIHDYELKIKNIIEKVEENIHTKKIELKDKKKEKSLNTLKKITKTKLAAFLTEYNGFMVEIRNIEERLKQHSIIEDIENIKNKLKLKDEDIEKIELKIKELKEKITKIDIRDLKNKVKEKIDQLLEIDLNLD